MRIYLLVLLLLATVNCGPRTQIAAPVDVEQPPESAVVTGSGLAYVVLKEQRRLVLVPRETPLHTGHCEVLLKASQIGAVIAPRSRMDL